MKSSTRASPRRQRPPGVKSKSRQTVRFKFTDPAARKVSLAGTFNDWKPESSRMIPLGDGRWAKNLTLAPGVYEYRVVVDGSWKPDPGADHAVLNEYGERNSLLTVLEERED